MSFIGQDEGEGSSFNHVLLSPKGDEPATHCACHAFFELNLSSKTLAESLYTPMFGKHPDFEKIQEWGNSCQVFQQEKEKEISPSEFFNKVVQTINLVVIDKTREP